MQPSPPLQGRLPTGRWQLPHYSVHWLADRQQLQIFALSQGVQEAFPLLKTPAGESFLQFHRQGFVHREKRGSFQIQPPRAEACRQQSLKRIAQRDGEVLMQGTLDGAPNCRAHYQIRLSESRGLLRLQISVQPQQQPHDSASENQGLLTLALERAPHVAYRGLGEQFSHLDLRGQRFPMIVQEGGIGRGAQPVSGLLNTVSPGSAGHSTSSYFPLPFLWNARNQALILQHRGFSVFDLRAPGRLQIQVSGAHLDANLFSALKPLELLEKASAVIGRPPLPPDWLHRGAIIGAQGGSERVRKIWKQLQAAELPITAFWLQDWVGKRKTAIGSQLWWNWELNTQHYDQWQALQREWQAQDIRVMGYINPFLVDVETRPHTRNLYREALQAGYLVKTPKGEPYPIQNTDFAAGLVDLSHPEARAWMQAIIQSQMIAGPQFSAWMADYAEALPLDARIHSPHPAGPEADHNDYPRRWAQVNAEAIRQSGCKDCLFFMRSGFLGSIEVTPLFWSGDQMVDWSPEDGLGSAVTALISSGLSGIALNHSDVGGYTSIVQPVLQPGWRRSGELLQRWSEMAAFTPVFRSHEGNQPEVNAQIYDTAQLRAYAQQARVFAALFDYRKRLFQEASSKGWPLVRHPLLHFPYDLQVQKLKDQFMLGEALMVAPILKPGQRFRRVYLPAGQWTHLWSGLIMGQADQGSWVKVPAPLGQTPVFYPVGHPVGQELTKKLSEVISSSAHPAE